MDSSEAAVARRARAFHDDVPHDFQVSLSMSVHTRELLRTVRDDLNERAGEPILTTNDVVQLALVGAARYHELAADADGDAGDPPLPDGPLLAALHDAVAADDDVTF